MIQSCVSPWLTPLAYFLGKRLVMPLFFKRIEVTGQENLPLTGPVILAPTHRSRWDALLVPFSTGRIVTGRDVRFMVSADEVKGIQGWLIRRLGGFPVNTRQPGIASLRYGLEIMQNREMLVIFPEGGIFRNHEINPLKPGLARLALQAENSQPELGIKIVPMTIHYSQLLPSWGTSVQIHIGRPIEVAAYIQGTAKEEAKRLTADLTNALNHLNQLDAIEASETPGTALANCPKQSKMLTTGGNP